MSKPNYAGPTAIAIAILAGVVALVCLAAAATAGWIK